MNDANTLISLAKEMGLIDLGYFNNMPNATKCNTIKDIYSSHVNDLVILEVNDIYGMLIILAFGLGVSLVLFMSEIIFKVGENHFHICGFDLIVYVISRYSTGTCRWLTPKGPYIKDVRTEGGGGLV